MSTKKTANCDFASSLKELEDIVSAIEHGGISLEESLNLFTRGVALTKECQKKLQDAEQKIKILSGKNLEEFTPDLAEDA